MPSPFHNAYLKAADTLNPETPHSEAFELFELGRYYRQHGKIYEPIRSLGDGVYEGARSKDRFTFNYDAQAIEPVRDARLEQGRGR
jgi:hypothetical protein